MKISLLKALSFCFGSMSVEQQAIDFNKALFRQTRQLNEQLWEASEQGDSSTVSKLLHHVDINAADEDGQTSLHKAAQQGHDNIVSLLLKSGAHCKADKDGYTPLHKAAYNNHVDIVKTLVTNGRYNTCEESLFGYTPMQLAVYKGNTKVVKFLLDQGASADETSSTPNLFRPLHVATNWVQEPMVELLLQYGASTQATTIRGFTPLDIALIRGQKKSVRALLEYGAQLKSSDQFALVNILKIPQKQRNLILAVIYNCTACIENLLNKNMLTQDDFSAVDASGMNVFMWGAVRSNVETMLKFIQYCRKNHIVIDITAANRKGESALTLAQKHKRQQIIQIISENPIKCAKL